MRRNGKSIAPESVKTGRARKKILKIWEKEEKQLTPKALKETVDKIHQWIADNAKERVPIKGKSIKLFNQNKDAAALSQKIEKLKMDMQKIFG